LPLPTGPAAERPAKSVARPLNASDAAGEANAENLSPLSIADYVL